jgi:hypothetical protein
MGSGELMPSVPDPIDGAKKILALNGRHAHDGDLGRVLFTRADDIVPPAVDVPPDQGRVFAAAAEQSARGDDRYRRLGRGKVRVVAARR